MKNAIFASFLSVSLAFTGMSAAFAQDIQEGGSASGASAGSAAVAGESSRVWSERSITPNRFELQVLSGPNTVQALSINYGALIHSTSIDTGGFFGTISTTIPVPGAFAGNREFGMNISRTGISEDGESFGASGVTFPIGVAFAPIDNLEVGISMPIAFKDGGFGSLPIWATYQFTEGNFEVGIRGAFFMPTASYGRGFGDRFQFQVGAPVLVRFGNMRLDTGLFYTIQATPESPTHFIKIPARLGFQITDVMYAGVQTGFDLIAFGGGGDPYFGMPLYGFFGYTLNTDVTPIDLGFRFGFDNAIKANDGTGNAADFNDFSFAIGANFAFQF